MSTARASRPASALRPVRDEPWMLANEGVVRIPRSAATSHAGFRDWVTSEEFPEGVRATFVDREILIELGPEELQTHAAPRASISGTVGMLNRERRLGRYFLRGALVTNRAAGVSNEPDLTFVSYESLRTRRVELTPRRGKPGQYIEMVGTPDMVLEVVSVSSVEKDTKLLMAAYHRAGIPEYWLADARDEPIDFRILRHGPRGYRPAPSRGGWRRSTVFGRSFRLDRQLDEVGLWDYTLHVR